MHSFSAEILDNEMYMNFIVFVNVWRDMKLEKIATLCWFS